MENAVDSLWGTCDCCSRTEVAGELLQKGEGGNAQVGSRWVAAALVVIRDSLMLVFHRLGQDLRSEPLPLPPDDAVLPRPCVGFPPPSFSASTPFGFP